MKRFYFTVLFVLFAAGTVFGQAEGEREKGVRLYHDGEYQKALEPLQKAVETDEENRDLWLYIGMAYAKLNNEEKAAEIFRKADEASIKHPKGYDKQSKITFQPNAVYSDAARQNRVQGTVKLAVELTAKGEIGVVFPFEKLAGGLTEQAVEAVRRLKFEPAEKKGEPADTVIILAYAFKIH